MEKMKVLVADSNVLECQKLEDCFSCVPEFVILPSVFNGDELIRRIQETRADILILDPMLIGIDGISALNMIAELDFEIRPAVFIYSLLYSEELMQLLKQKGVRYCFIKPTDHMRIVACVLELMNVGKTLQDSPKEEQQVSVQAAKENRENEITFQIRAVGMPAHLKGYHYLREAISMVVSAELPTQLNITTNIYPQIAKLFNTRPALVERAIRHAIEVAWDRGKPEVLDRYFGYTVNDSKGKPTNAEFIAMIADRVRTHMGK